MSELPIKLTLKAGAGYDAPWITVDAADPSDLGFKVAALNDGELLQNVIDLANVLKAANAIGSSAPVAAPAAPTAVPASAPGWAQPAQAAAPVAPPQQPAVRFHPEGILCSSCNAGVIFKQIQSKASGKTFQLWTCPNQKSKGDGHYSEFAN